VVAANIVGTANIKENSAAALRLSPTTIPPMMVAAERETPGTVARAWKTPIKNDFFRLIPSDVSNSFFLPEKPVNTQKNQTSYNQVYYHQKIVPYKELFNDFIKQKTQNPGRNKG